MRLVGRDTERMDARCCLGIKSHKAFLALPIIPIPSLSLER